MSTINERFKEIRKATGLSQEAFGKRIGLSRSELKNIEYGITIPKEVTIPLICREFAVNETWLRTGEGQMQEDRTRRDEILGVMGKVAALPEGSPEFFMMGVLADMLSKIDSKYWGEIADKVVERAEAYKEAKKNETP